MDVVLRLPSESEEAEFLRAHRATSPSVRNFLHSYEEGMSFRRYLEVLAERERGENLPADDDNVGSIKTIEKNGGVLESIVTGTDGEQPTRRYWIGIE